MFLRNISLFKKPTARFCATSIKDVTKSSAYAYKFKHMSGQCAQIILDNYKKGSLRLFTQKLFESAEFNSLLFECTGKPLKNIYPHIKAILHFNIKNHPQAVLNIRRFLDCLVEINLIYHSEKTRILGITTPNFSQRVSRLENYLLANAFNNYVPEPQDFLEQWEKENDGFLNYTIDMYQRVSKIKTSPADNKRYTSFDQIIPLWFLKLTEKIKQLQAKVVNGKTRKRSSIRLMLFNAEEAAMIFLKCFFKCWSRSDLNYDKKNQLINLMNLQLMFGKLCEREASKKFGIGEFVDSFKYKLINIDGIVDEYKQNLIMKEKKLTDDPNCSKSLVWEKRSMSEMGAEIFGVFHEIATLINSKGQICPAFKVESVKAARSFYRNKVVILSKEFISMMDRDTEFAFKLQLFYYDLPMKVRPREWMSPVQGGYIVNPKPIIQMKKFWVDSVGLYEKLSKEDLYELFKCLNSLQKCSWVINRRVLDVVNYYKRNELKGSGLPGKLDQKPIEKLTDIGLEILDDKENFSKSTDRYNALKTFKKNYLEHTSIKAMCNLKTSVANLVKNDTFFFPFFLDFRGRCYPGSPYLNHNGDDLTRGLLKFEKRRELGESGWKWLLTHVCNLYGRNKISLAERIQWSESKMADILASARDPLKHKWWSFGDEPWQILACCFEIEEAVNSGNKYEFRSNIAVYQDGSCNGLQHYSAMGRDEAAAELVNMNPSESPNDAYTKVLQIVKKAMKKDQTSSDEDRRRLSLLLYDKIDRKVLKQTVMTTVYGVTYIGAKEQIMKNLKKRKYIDDEDTLNEAAAYLTGHVLESVNLLFQSANNTMKWLRHSAKLIVSAGYCVSWLTPLNLPAIQQYGINTESVADSFVQTPDGQSQTMAFPPNFVHSLDSTHMLMTARECEKTDITFASVHDSYWTHACDVERMNVILRENFIRLHSKNPLDDLRAQFVARFPKLHFRELPPKGRYDLDNLRKAPYFFC